METASPQACAKQDICAHDIDLVGNRFCDVPSYIKKPSCVMLRESQSLSNEFSVVLIYSPNLNLVFQ